MVDGLDHSVLNHSKLLGAAAAFSRYLRKEFPDDERIAIVLPASKGAVVANLAVALAGKVPVGLNFTSGRAAIESSCKRANLRVAISATPFMQRLGDFPWPERVLKLDELMPQLKPQIVRWLIMSILAPAGLLLRLLQIPKQGGHGEAILLFTSGSSGEPKGVVLSHRNILGNVSQFNVLLDAKEDDAILASLPFFHSFGSTVTLWYPLIEGVRIVTYPNPLEAAKNAALIDKYKLTLLLATPTFLRAYLRKAEPEQFRSLRLIITGAEKLPLDLAKTFEDRFGKHVFEGYGLTETAPVVSVNLPEPKPKNSGDTVQPSSRSGSVGKWRPESPPKSANRKPIANFRCTKRECFGCAAQIFSKVICTIRNGPRKFCATAGSRPATSAGSMKTDFFTSKDACRAFQRSAAKWCRTKRSNKKSSAALGLDGQSERV